MEPIQIVIASLFKTDRFKVILRGLRYRNFRLFFYGQGVSLIGTWMQTIAMGWLVFRLTNSVFLLGLVGFAAQVPAFIFSPIAGVYVDRVNRHRLLILTQTLSMIQAFMLAFLAFTGFITVWQVILLSIFLGIINAFDMPCRQAFFVDMIEKKEDIGNAIALNSFMFNGARLIGPSIAGILIALLGESACFFINGVSFLAVIVALLAMKITPKETTNQRSYLLQELQEGFRYAFNLTPIKSIILLLALISFMGMPYLVMMPIFAKEILHGGPQILGFLIASSGIGALFGAIYLASMEGIAEMGRVTVIASIIFGTGLIAFSLSRIFWLSVFILLFIGAGMMVYIVSSNIILQTLVEEDKRGRVMSLFAMAFFGMEPFGSLWAGSLASMIGAPKMLMTGGAFCIIGSMLFAKKLIRIQDPLDLYEESAVPVEVIQE